MNTYVRARNTLTVNDQYLTPTRFSWRRGDVLPSDHAYVLAHHEHFDPAPDLTGKSPDEAADAGRQAQREDILRAGANGERATAGGTERLKSTKRTVEELATRGAGGATMRQAADSWATRAADVLTHNRSELRAVVSGSVDIPRLVPTDVQANPHPERLLDLLINRQQITGNEFEFIRQTVRDNQADVVPDGGTKPTSIFTVTPITDRARVIAHLSEPASLRIFADHQNLVTWLRDEMVEGVLNALEAQVVAGDGTGENLTGILETTGTTAVPFATDKVTTLRKTRTALQTLGESPTSWTISPSDAEELDLIREGTDGGWLISTAPSNVFGTFPIVVSPSIPANVAVLADWRQARLVVREDVRLDVDTSGTLFETNSVRSRAEGRFGLGVLRPQAFAVAELEISS